MVSARLSDTDVRPPCMDVARHLSPAGHRCLAIIQRAQAESRLANVLEKNRDGEAQAAQHRERANQMLGQADQCIAGLPAGGNESSGTAAASPRHVITERDIPTLAARQHPGQKWGYLKMHWNASDYVGEDLVVKVPNSAPDGALIEVPAPEKIHDPWTAVRGYVRRGQGPNGTDVFEVVAVHHRAHHGLGGDLEVDGWRDSHQKIALTH